MEILDTGYRVIMSVEGAIKKPGEQAQAGKLPLTVK